LPRPGQKVFGNESGEVSVTIISAICSMVGDTGRTSAECGDHDQMRSVQGIPECEVALEAIRRRAGR
jgi:hypothetical protein